MTKRRVTKTSGLISLASQGGENFPAAFLPLELFDVADGLISVVLKPPCAGQAGVPAFFEARLKTKKRFLDVP
jgi:hypothetical protein